MSRLRKIGYSTIFSVLFLTAGCRSHQQQANSVQVRLKWLNQAQFAGFYTAAEKGFYRDNNLQVKINPGGSDFPAVQMVVGGGEQFGVTGADQILLARAKGIPVVAVAVIYRETPFVLFSLQSSDIRVPHDMIGKDVGVKLGGNEELTYRAMMKMAGVDTKRLHEKPVKFDMAPLFAGQVQVWPGYAINEPIVAKEMGYSVNIISPSQVGLHMYADTIFTTEDMIRTHPDEVAAFVSATMKGWDYSVAHPSEAVDATLRYDANLKPAHEMAMMLTSIPFIKGDGQLLGLMSEQSWQDLQNILREEGFLNAPVDVTAAFTNRFVAPQP